MLNISTWCVRLLPEELREGKKTEVNPHHNDSWIVR